MIPLDQLILGHIYLFPPHHHDSGGMWENVANMDVPAWESVFSARVEDFAAHGWTLELEPGYELPKRLLEWDSTHGGYRGFPTVLAWAESVVGQDGVPACRCYSRQHAPGTAADSAYALELCGVPFRPLLGSFAKGEAVGGDIAPKYYTGRLGRPKAPSRRYDILVGGDEVIGHGAPSTYPAGIVLTAQGQVNLKTGNAITTPTVRIPKLLRALDAGTIPVGIGWVSGNANQRAGHPYLTLSADGSPYVPAMEAGVALDPSRIHVAPQEAIVAAWRRTPGLGDFLYQEGLLP